MSDTDSLLRPVGEQTLYGMFNRNSMPVEAVPTMLPTWNQMCRDEGGGVGLAHGWHVIVAGKTGSGKSLFGLNLAAAAMKKKYPVGFISLEMSRTQLVTRALSIVSGERVSRLEPGPDYDQEVFQQAAQRWVDTVENKLFVNKVPIHSLGDIETAMVRAYEQDYVRCFITDYLQLAWVSDAKGLQDQITEVSHKIRGLAQKYQLVSIGLSQYNRETSKSKDRPEATGLMGGSSLENDADQVVLLDHTTFKKTSKTSATQEVLLAKNRHGSKGRIAVAWDFTTLRVTELQEGAADDEDDAPF
jgi:replicative DNA helicase